MTTRNRHPIFADTPEIGAVEISTANTNRNGTGTLGTVVTADAAGTKIDLITVVAEGTTTAGMIRLFLHDGSVFYLLKEIDVTAITPSGTVKAFTAEWQPTKPISLLSGWTLRAATHNAEVFNVMAFGGHYG